MEKILKHIFLMVVGFMYITLGQAHAFDFMADVDEVSRDPWKAYTMYCGMPFKNFINDFNKAPGWSICDNTGPIAFYVKEESINSSVKEAVVGFSSGEGYLWAHSIYFYTDSIELADRIFERLTNNIENSLGKPYRVETGIKSDKSFRKFREKTWKCDDKTVGHDWLVVSVRYGINDSWWLTDSRLKSKCVVDIHRD